MSIDWTVATDKLTPRQSQIVEHLCAAQSYDQIALVMGISVQTIKSHLQTAKRNSGAESTLHLAVQYALQSYSRTLQAAFDKRSAA